ncbi:MAG: hypothetical protein YHS30scaffold392_12 [Phage 64_12]|nr:hypothetical protein [Xanthomonadales bacterium]QOR55669.1 MAG: hypothetical protein YHS30scaffold392_12 [Phage 64_12]
MKRTIFKHLGPLGSIEVSADTRIWLSGVYLLMLRSFLIMSGLVCGIDAILRFHKRPSTVPESLVVLVVLAAVFFDRKRETRP